MTQEHDAFGDIRSLLADYQFLAALRVAGQMSQEVSEVALTYVERAVEDATRVFDVVSVDVQQATDTRALELWRLFYPEEEAPTDACLYTSGFMFFATYQTSKPVHEHIVAHKVLEVVLSKMTSESYRPAWKGLERCASAYVASRIPRLLVEGLLLETPVLDEYPDNAHEIGQTLGDWLGEGGSFWSNTTDGAGYYEVCTLYDNILDEVIVGVGEHRVVVLWVGGES